MGEVGGTRHYDGPGLGTGPWNCPACDAVNTGPIHLGCTTCSSGKPGYKVTMPAVWPADPEPKQFQERVPASDPIYGAAERWAQQHPEAALEQAFIAGYQLAQGVTLHAPPPVTADVASLAPEGKPRRTIIAALQLFKDQVLAEHPEEIETGEWCSPEEVDQLLVQLTKENE